MPLRGMSARGLTSTESRVRFLEKLHRSVRTETSMSAVKVRVLDSVRPDGPKLVELPSDTVSAFRALQPGLRLVPVVYYYPALEPHVRIREGVRRTKTKQARKLTLRVLSSPDGTAVAGAFVVAFTDFEEGLGAQGTTNRRGEVGLELGGATRLERLYVYPAKGFWSLLKKNVKLSARLEVHLRAVELGFTDCVRHFYGKAEDGSGSGVRVGVVDSGVSVTHPDLRVDGGFNSVVGEDPDDFGDAGSEHGTHVAGIIAARGTPPAGIRGIAPGVTLRSYRVFGRNADRASNYSIVKAIDRAVADRCDLINMSLGGGPSDDATRSAMEEARAQGAVVIVAAGNDGRGPVSFPASDQAAIAVSAMGRKGTFPSGTTEASDVKTPFGRDRKNFVAAFSNVGAEIDLTGPGVGVLSTVPGGYAPLSGTSMACPAVVGVTARRLSRKPDLLGIARGEGRSDAIIRLLLEGARPLGFGPRFEGQGLP